jgi:hypothetical protein
MRVLIVLLLLGGCLCAQPKLTPQDEREIRAAITALAKQENQRDSGDVWSERLPQMYRVRSIDAVSSDVATADADGSRIGTFFERAQFVFILRRDSGHWAIARQLRVYTGPGPVLIRPVEAPPK